MRRFLTFTTALLVALAGTVAVAQQVTTPEALDAAMKKIGAAQGATAKAIKSDAFADARTQVAIVKQALGDVQGFWAANKKDDAVQMAKDAIAKITALEAALSAATPNQEAAFAAFKEAGGTCAACHKAYRVQNEDKTYSLRPGAI